MTSLHFYVPKTFCSHTQRAEMCRKDYVQTNHCIMHYFHCQIQFGAKSWFSLMKTQVSENLVKFPVSNQYISSECEASQLMRSRWISTTWSELPVFEISLRMTMKQLLLVFLIIRFRKVSVSSIYIYCTILFVVNWSCDAPYVQIRKRRFQDICGDTLL